MATVDGSGIRPTDLTSYVGRIERVLQDALGADLNLASETPQGQIAGLLGLALAEVDEVLVHVAAGLSLQLAGGRQLDDYGSLLRIPRIAGERSSVTATLTGAPATLVPAGSRARTRAGALFATDADARIGAAGSVQVVMRSTDIGPVLAPAGELASIVDVISGWTGVSNAADASPGHDAETDAEYRRRYSGEVAVHARESLEALQARTLEVPGVVAVVARDNPTASDETVQGLTIGPHSVAVIVQGGADDDVARAIAAAKPLGIPTSGAESEVVGGVTIRYSRVAPLPIRVAVTTRLGAAFPSDGVLLIRQRLADWVAGDWRSAPGDFDTGGIAIGESLDAIRLYTPISSVPGHAVQQVVVTDGMGQAIPSSLDLVQRITLDPADVSVSVAP